MRAQLEGPVEYELKLGDQTLPLAPLLGHPIRLEFMDKLFCVHCEKEINKSFNQGYCFQCFQTLAQCDSCIIRPELCHYARGTCREPDWAEKFCMTEHIVYLSHTSGTKVGITRKNQVPTRWIDQGATQAIPIYSVKTRHISGLVEVIYKEFVDDRTNWRKMLSDQTESEDLEFKRDELFELAEGAVEAINEEANEEVVQYIEDAPVVEITYPILNYPKKIKSVSFDKQKVISGKLQGIKGQYLIFDDSVLNMRKHSGYLINVQC